MTPSVIAAVACLGLAVLLLLAFVILQGRTINRLAERVGVLETWAATEDPGWWRERLGREDAGFVNDDPEPDTPVDCLDAGRLHEPDKTGRSCMNCPATFTPTRP